MRVFSPILGVLCHVFLVIMIEKSVFPYLFIRVSRAVSCKLKLTQNNKKILIAKKMWGKVGKCGGKCVPLQIALKINNNIREILR